MRLFHLLAAALILVACGPAASVQANNAAAQNTVATTNTAQVMAANEAKPGEGISTGGTEAAKPGGDDTSTGGDDRATQVTNAADQAEAAACQARGGTYGPVCLGGEMMCVERFPDAGHTCTDGSQCRGGACYYEGRNPAPGERVTGTCVQSTNPCGCHARVENGHTEGALCVD